MVYGWPLMSSAIKIIFCRFQRQITKLQLQKNWNETHLNSEDGFFENLLISIYFIFDFVLINYKKKWNQPIISEVSNNIISRIGNRTIFTFKTGNIFWRPFSTQICRSSLWWFSRVDAGVYFSRKQFYISASRKIHLTLNFQAYYNIYII